VDDLVRRYVLPKRILWQSQEFAGSEQTEKLLQYNGMQSVCYDSSGCKIKCGDKPWGILLDFGCELNGGIRIIANDTSGRKPVRLRIRFGESVSEAMGEPNNDHAIHDSILNVPCLSMVDYGNTGFRFVRIDLLDKDTYINISQIYAVFVLRNLEYKGEFECSDKQLNKIWQTGAYTVHLNMQEYLWDGIKRDRLVWVGDMHPEVMTINSVFGFNDIVPRSLDLVRDKSPLPGWMNNIPSYSLWWILVQRDWYLYQGDFEYLRQQKDYLIELIANLLKYIDKNNREILPEMRFLDWPTSRDKSALDAGLQALMILAFKAAAWLCKHLNVFSAERKCLDAVTRLLSCDPVPTQRKQAVAMMALANILDAKTVNQKFLSEQPCSDFSTFFGYYILQARSLANDYKGALDVIREYWGAMLGLGATTFWENFDISWKDSARIDRIVPDGEKDFHLQYGDYCYKGLRHSLCHGWATGPTAWLSEHVLGFHPLEPGSKKLLIKPELADLDWAKGTLPTPYGPVSVSHSKDKDGQVQTFIKKPDGIEVVKQEQSNKNHRMEINVL
jgi:hypothetical protein